MRGEHGCETPALTLLEGSSPHARRALHAEHRRHAGWGIIPACAGSTQCPSTAAIPARDHPRMRGEHLIPLAASCAVVGSSPHARGALARRLRQPGEVGIIPACAGSTAGTTARVRCPRDHPRMRGEHDAMKSGNPQQKGSSPHARGARRVLVDPEDAPGIIPACAGSTTSHRTSTASGLDHPRMRGEHRDPKSDAALPAGSSPHARGAPVVAHLLHEGVGIIPACAGSTHGCRDSGPRAGDHPRMRGEHYEQLVGGIDTLGSSPHARGAPPTRPLPRERARIIPACAGSTRRSTTTRTRTRDHPRMRGEHASQLSHAALAEGSSPHARGAHLEPGVYQVARGIIPACAGSTLRW